MAISEHAAAAKEIRKELKKHGIPAKVRANSYSMGSSVYVDLYDALPATVEKVREFADRYQYGSFDGMEDIYNHDNVNPDLPQVKHVIVQNDISEELNQSAWDYVRENFDGFDGAPVEYGELSGVQHEQSGEWAYTFVHRVISGYTSCGFWATQKPRVRAA